MKKKYHFNLGIIFSVLNILFITNSCLSETLSSTSESNVQVSPSPKKLWTLYQHENRDYVSMRNIAEFYKLEVIPVISSKVELRSSNCVLKGQINSKEFTINGLKVILSYDLIAKNNEVLLSRIDLTKLLEPILRPNRIRNARPIKTVVLDPGHGGFDRGAISPYGDEKSLALDVCLRAKEILSRRGFHVEMTRSSDIFVPLQERARFANRFRNGLFICVHFNDGSPTSTGVETYTLAPRFVPSTDQDGPAVTDLQLCAGNIDDPENMALATAMHAAMLSRVPMVDRGIKRARFWVLRECTIPGVLVEGGFLSNYSEAFRISQISYRQSLAEAIVLAVENYQYAISIDPLHALLVEANKNKPEATHKYNSALTNVENMVSIQKNFEPDFPLNSRYHSDLLGNDNEKGDSEISKKKKLRPLIHPDLPGTHIPLDLSKIQLGEQQSNGPIVVVPRKE